MLEHNLIYRCELLHDRNVYLFHSGGRFDDICIVGNAAESEGVYNAKGQFFRFEFSGWLIRDVNYTGSTMSYWIEVCVCTRRVLKNVIVTACFLKNHRSDAIQ
jgi:hypothetical protein